MKPEDDELDDAEPDAFNVSKKTFDIVLILLLLATVVVLVQQFYWFGAYKLCDKEGGILTKDFRCRDMPSQICIDIDESIYAPKVPVYEVEWNNTNLNNS